RYQFESPVAGRFAVRLDPGAGFRAVVADPGAVTLGPGTHVGIDLGARRLAPDERTILTVTSTADDTAADDALSLREALTLLGAGTVDAAGNGLGRALTAGELALVTGPLSLGGVIHF